MKRFVFVLASLLFASSAFAGTVGEVSTSWKLLGDDHKIVVESFEDPLVDGVVCHVSRAKTGGLMGSVGLATDKSDASIACRQVGEINIMDDRIISKDADGDLVFKKSTSILFKKLQVVRFYDKEHRTLIYLSYSDKLIDGSPKNSISTVPVRPWQ